MNRGHVNEKNKESMRVKIVDLSMLLGFVLGAGMTYEIAEGGIYKRPDYYSVNMC